MNQATLSIHEQQRQLYGIFFTESISRWGPHPFRLSTLFLRDGTSSVSE